MMIFHAPNDFYFINIAIAATDINEIIARYHTIHRCR